MKNTKIKDWLNSLPVSEDTLVGVILFLLAAGIVVAMHILIPFVPER